MAVTQFLFMGFQVLMPDEFGVVGTREQFEAFNHLWRVLGYMLGTEDRFNACGETLEETRSRLQSIKEDIILPALKMSTPEIEAYVRNAYEGTWYSDPTMHFGEKCNFFDRNSINDQTLIDSRMFSIKRLCDYPGYHYFESESQNHKAENTEIFSKLSLYTRFRIFIDIIVYEHLCHFAVSHFLLNIGQLIIALLGLYPLLPLLAFGKKYAFVEVMKTRKAN